MAVQCTPQKFRNWHFKHYVMYTRRIYMSVFTWSVHAFETNTSVNGC